MASSLGLLAKEIPRLSLSYSYPAWSIAIEAHLLILGKDNYLKNLRGVKDADKAGTFQTRPSDIQRAEDRAIVGFLFLTMEWGLAKQVQNTLCASRNKDLSCLHVSYRRVGLMGQLSAKEVWDFVGDFMLMESLKRSWNWSWNNKLLAD